MKLINCKELIEKIKPISTEKGSDGRYVKLFDLIDVFASIEIETVDDDEIKALTERAEKAEEQCESLLDQLDDLRDIKDEIMAERDIYKAVARTVEALTGKEIL